MLRITGKSATGFVLGLLVVTGCTAEMADQVPYYNDSLRWFSSSEYDPEVQAIGERISPPGGLREPVAPVERSTPEGAASAEAKADTAASEAPMSSDAVMPSDGDVRAATGATVRTNVSSGMSASSGSSELGGGTSAGGGATTAGAGGTTTGAGGGSLPLVGSRNSLGSSITPRATR